MPLRAITGKLGGPCGTAPAVLPSMIWQFGAPLPRELRAFLDVGQGGVRGKEEAA